MTTHWLQQAGEAITAFAQVIGLPLDRLVAGEQLERIQRYEEAYRAQSFCGLTFAAVQKLIEAFDDSLRLAVRVGDLPILDVTRNTSEADVHRFLEEIGKHDTVVLDLAIDKSRLLQQRLQAVPSVGHRCYFFSARFAELLRGTLANPRMLEDTLWHEQSTNKVVVLLGDRDLFLDGPFLAVVGGSALARVGEIAESSPVEADQVAHFYRICRNTVRWEEEWTQFLTPRHFQIAGDHAPSDPIAMPLLAHWSNLAIITLADRIVRRDSGIVAVFAVEKARCEVGLITTDDGCAAIHHDEVSWLGAIADWAYEGKWTGDRVRMAQASIARSLAFGQQPRPCASLLERAKAINGDLEWLWKTFISEEIERYSEEERTLEAEVAETVEAFDKQVSEMIGSLSTTMLAAVGVLIGSLIAAVVKDSFKASIFLLGVYAYTAYLVLFPGLYNMVHHCLRFRAVGSIFLKRRQRFERMLDRSVVSRIVGQHVASARKRFWAWFIATIVAYLVVLALCLLAARVVPSVMGSAPPDARASGKHSETGRILR